MIFKRHIEDSEAVSKWLRTMRPDGLTPSEKEAGRALLSEYMALHPMRHAPATHTKVSMFLPSWHMSAFAFGLILVLTTGTTYAAEQALPGNPLYAIKVHVNEEVRGALAVGEKEQADWSITRAERRLEEASALAVRGELDTNTRATIQEQLETHLAHATANKERLEEEHDSIAVVEVDARLNAILNAHIGVLEAIAMATQRENTRSEIETIRTDVGGRIAFAETDAPPMTMKTMAFSASVAPEVAVPASAPVEAPSVERVINEQTAARTRIESAERSLKRVLSKLRSSANTDLRLSAEAKLAAAKEAYNVGKVAFKEDQTEEASAQFTTALRAAFEVEALLNARMHILNVLTTREPRSQKTDSDKGERAADETITTSATIDPSIEIKTEEDEDEEEPERALLRAIGSFGL